MEISLFWNITFVSALSLGFFLSIVLLGQYFKDKHLSQLFLGTFVFIFSTILLNNFVYWNQAMGEYPHFIYSTVSTRFLLAPLFYLYCITFLERHFDKKKLWHLLPFLLLTILFLPIILSSGAEKIALVNSFREGNYPWWSYYTRHMNWFLSVHLIIYPILIYSKLKKYVNGQKQPLAKDKRHPIQWLYFLNSLVLLYGLLMLIYFVLVAFEIGGIEKDYYISFVMCLAIYGTSFIGMTNPELLKGEQFLQRISRLKYKNTPLDEVYLNQTMHRLEQLMQTEKVYLNADINLQQIAQIISIPRHHISQVLNQQQGKTFHEFINQYRIEYACQLLENPSTVQNIKTIVYESGFNNRASFNNNFKKIKGMTASEYLNRMAET